MKINFKLLLLSLLFSLNVSAGLIAGSGGGLVGPIGTTDINDSAVTSAKILNGTITSADLTTSLVLTTMSASGDLTLIAGGLKFPATQVVSANANTLDDYEEGTFTPTVIGTSTAGAGTYASQFGKYTKIGRMVNFTIYLNWTNHTGTGNIGFGGLPFTNGPDYSNYSQTSIFSTTLALTAAYYPIIYNDVSTTQLILAQTPTGGGNTVAVPMDTSAILIFTGNYVTD
jgi:hypothetical protein